MRVKALVARGDAGPALAAADKYRVFQDAPWCHAPPVAVPGTDGAVRKPLYQQLAVRYPRAKFVLTTRETDAWWSSTRQWLEELKPDNIPKVTVLGRCRTR